jgi:CDP-diacylglycerol--glycerol-3-phosphate 3-phosphatidyltransferase
MYPMIQKILRAPVTRAITPLCRGMLNIGFTANSVTVIGAVGVIVSSLYFFTSGSFFLGTIFVTLFVLSDLLDGTMARISQSSGTKWGALLDSTLDRISDTAILLGIYFGLKESREIEANLVLATLLISALIPYIRARAESLGFECGVGYAERTERLILILVATGLYGLGFENAFVFALPVLLFLGIHTIYLRMRIVYKG